MVDAGFVATLKRWNTSCREGGEHAFVPHPYAEGITICRHCGELAAILLAAKESRP